MALIATVSTIATMGVLVAFGWAIDSRGAVGLIAGYDPGDLPPKRERELARDVRNVLVASAVLCLPLLVDYWILTLPTLLLIGLPVVGVLLLTAGLVRKYDDFSR
jgi:hypothetical protein